MAELVPEVLALAQAAARAGMGLNIDAEEADRLDLSLDVIEAVLADAALAGWDGFGVVVQAYGQRAVPVIDWLHALATRLDRRIMVRLVKGAYWDGEIKKAQVEGLADFPVLPARRRPMSPTSAAPRKLLARARPDLSAIRHPQRPYRRRGAGDGRRHASGWEFQRLHGMGEALHDLVRAERRPPAAGSTPRSARIATCWPIWCGGCWRTAPIRPSSTRSSTPRSRPRRWPPIRSRR